MNASSLEQTRPLSPRPALARHELRSLLESVRWPGDVESVVLAVHEAMINSERHAGGAHSARASLDGWDLIVEVRDGGPGFSVDPYAAGPPDAMAEQGRGLWIISQIAERWEVRHHKGQTSLRLRFRP